MRTRASIIATLFFAYGIAHAGFRHPVEEGTPEAIAIESTPVYSRATSSSARILPDRAAAARPAAPQKAGAAELPSARKPSQAFQLPTTLPSNVKGPVPRAADLPSADHLGIPGISIPRPASRDGLLFVKPEAPSLKGANRAQIHAFLRNARGLKLPTREYGTDVRSRSIVDQFRAALNPTPYRSFRTAYQLHQEKLAKIFDPPAADQYENMVKRIDSLFLGLDNEYPRAIVKLWELAQAKNNPRQLQARDALFAGIMSQRVGWDTPASLLFAESAEKRSDYEERYLNILWNQLEDVKNPSNIQHIVSKVTAAQVAKINPKGDQANFAMAKLALAGQVRAPLAPMPSFEVFAARIDSPALRDRVSLLKALADLRSSSESIRAKATEDLRALESSGHSSVQQEARLALARTTLRQGNGADAMALYRNVEKNRRNRLEVLAEQTYAEYLAGEYQDSLGKAVALESPSFQYGFSPDVHLVEILSRKAICDFGGAEAGVKLFIERYQPELAALDALLARKPAAGDFYAELVSYVDEKEPKRFERYLLQLAPVMENQKTMNQALADFKKVDTYGQSEEEPGTIRPAGLNAFAQSMRNRWGQHARDLRNDSSTNALREAHYMADRLRQTFAQVELIDLDISTSAAKNFNLQSALNFPARKPASEKMDRERLHWPFENEVWEDEIDFMKAKNPSKCAVTAAN